MVELKPYFVRSLNLKTRQVEISKRLAVSVADAIKLERREFGYPYYRVLTAYPETF